MASQHRHQNTHCAMVVRAATTVHGGDISADALLGESSKTPIKSRNWEAAMGADESDLVPLENKFAFPQLQSLVDNKSKEWIRVRGR
jgi:hypothetical protein